MVTASPGWTYFYLPKLGRGDFETYGPRGTNEFQFNFTMYVPTKYLKGWVAESWGLVDPTTIYYKIRPGIMWHANSLMPARELTAQDVADAFTYSLKNPGNGDLPPYLNFVDAPDKYTCNFHLFKPNPNTLVWTSNFIYGYGAMIYPKELINSPGGMADWHNHVDMGAGPFLLQNFVSGSSITYKKNDTYFEKATIKGKQYSIPFVDKLQIPIIEDEATRTSALRTGKIDILGQVRNLYKTPLQRSNPDLIFKRYIFTSDYSVVFKYSGTTPVKPFDNIKVRQAMWKAIDQKALLNTVYQDGELNGWPWMSETGLQIPIDQLPAASKDLYVYDVAKAKQLLTEAGYPTGFETSLAICFWDQGVRDMVEMVVGYWNAVGIKCSLIPVERAAFTSQIVLGKNYPQMMFTTAQVEVPQKIRIFNYTGESWNYAAKNDVVFDSLVDKSEAATNLDEAYKYLQQAGYHMLDDVQRISMPHAAWNTVWWPWVKNYYGEFDVGLMESPALAQTWIDTVAKEQMGY